ncbi:MAG: hypothetical protein ACLQBX_02490 [Candidatus Limnocylindrales bacterium]
MTRLVVRIARALLAVEFAVVSASYLFVDPSDLLGRDARIYQAATRAWLSGGDPWTASYRGTLFAGPPLSLLPLAPFAWLPPGTFVVLMMLASAVAAVYALRVLGLPAWWLLFPPLVQGIAEGNPNVIVLALLVSGSRLGGTVAVLFKVYAAIPLLLLGRWRALGLSFVVVIVTLPVLPWGAFVSHDVVGTLSRQSVGGWSAWVWLPLVPVALVALVAVGRRRAAWWATPALWPETQFHYSLLALPAITPLSAAVLAIPVHGLPAVALAVAAVERQLRDFVSPRVSQRLGKMGPGRPGNGREVPVAR